MLHNDNVMVMPASPEDMDEDRLELNLINAEKDRDGVLHRPANVELIYSARKPPRSSTLRRGVLMLGITALMVTAGVIIDRILMSSSYSEAPILSSPASVAEVNTMLATSPTVAIPPSPPVAVNTESPPEPDAPPQTASNASAAAGIIRRDGDIVTPTILKAASNEAAAPTAASEPLIVTKPVAIASPYHQTDSGVIEEHGRRIISPDLERALQQRSVVERLGDGRLKVRLPVDQLFHSGMVSLEPTSTEALDYISYVLRNFDGYTARFEVYTMSETEWTSSTSLALARQRGQALSAYLISHGVPVPRVGWSAKISDPSSAQQANAAGVENQAVALIIEP